MISYLAVITPYLAVAVLGIIVHIAKEKMKQDQASGAVSDFATWKAGWSVFLLTSINRTMLAFVVIIAAVILANEANQLTLAAAFAFGYAGDSMMNKWDKSANDNAK